MVTHAKSTLLNIYISYKLLQCYSTICSPSVTTYSQAKYIMNKQVGAFQDFLFDFSFELRETMFLEMEVPGNYVLQPQEPTQQLPPQAQATEAGIVGGALKTS